MTPQTSTQIDELGLIPLWKPSSRPPTDRWLITSHYFASYSKRRNPLNEILDKVPAADPGNLAVVVNRYVPRHSPNKNPFALPVTVVVVHACGMHKETWEPMLSFLDDLSQSPSSGYSISEIWALEPVHHGDAAVLNKDADLVVDSMNYPVDLLEFIERRIPLSLDIMDVPAYLPRHRRCHRQNLIAIGHSIGGTAVIHAALHSPEVFSLLVLVEPLVANPVTNVHKPFQLVESSTAKRVDTFTSKSALVQYFGVHPVYKTWTSEIIKLFAEFATVPNKDGSISLKTSKLHESKLASDRQSYQAIWYCLHSLSKDLHVAFVYGSKSLLIPSYSRILTSQQPPTSSVTEVEGGHMLVQENPKNLANGIHQVLEKHARRKGVASKHIGVHL